MELAPRAWCWLRSCYEHLRKESPDLCLPAGLFQTDPEYEIVLGVTVQVRCAYAR
jgi:hypothetical protein